MAMNLDWVFSQQTGTFYKAKRLALTSGILLIAQVVIGCLGALIFKDEIVGAGLTKYVPDVEGGDMGEQMAGQMTIGEDMS